MEGEDVLIATVQPLRTLISSLVMSHDRLPRTEADSKQSAAQSDPLREKRSY
jgi:hypothetical protein